VRVVKPYQTFTVETHPVLSERVDDDDLTIQIEQSVEAFVTPLMFHRIRLSVNDNSSQVSNGICQLLECK
jgi:hypothetical protein